MAGNSSSIAAPRPRLCATTADEEEAAGGAAGAAAAAAAAANGAPGSTPTLPMTARQSPALAVKTSHCPATRRTSTAMAQQPYLVGSRSALLPLPLRCVHCVPCVKTVCASEEGPHLTRGRTMVRMNDSSHALKARCRPSATSAALRAPRVKRNTNAGRWCRTYSAAASPPWPSARPTSSALGICASGGGAREEPPAAVAGAGAATTPSAPPSLSSPSPQLSSNAAKKRSSHGAFAACWHTDTRKPAGGGGNSGARRSNCEAAARRAAAASCATAAATLARVD